MEEKTLARFEELKSRSFAVEEKLRHAAEEVKRKAQERRKKPVGKGELKQRVAKDEASTEEEQDGEVYALRCRQGNAAYSAGDWARSPLIKSTSLSLVPHEMIILSLIFCHQGC